MPTVSDLLAQLNLLAPPALAEDYDNVGLLAGSHSAPITGVLTTLDATEAVVDEALARGCNTVVAHHPIIFKGLKSLTGRNYVERTIIKAIRNEINIIAIHTNLDAVQNGVNRIIGERLGLTEMKILAPKPQVLKKLVVFVPRENREEVAQALFKAGAGNLGKYTGCSFHSTGTGAFTPEEGADPAIGQPGKREEVAEDRLELVLPHWLQGKVLDALFKAHPYEEVAYDLITLDNPFFEAGSGMIGKLPEPMDEREFLLRVKQEMGAGCLRHTPLRGKPVRKVAVCGGSGAFLIRKAAAAGADVYVTADVKYHEFFDAEGQLVIADIGHYESEQYTSGFLAQFISEKFPNIAVRLTETVTNPLNYL